MADIHRILDAALAVHPDRQLLGDFRATPQLLRLESEALGEASQLITPHRAIADGDSQRLLLDWRMPKPLTRSPGSAVAFPGPTVGRKGAYGCCAMRCRARA